MARTRGNSVQWSLRPAKYLLPSAIPPGSSSSATGGEMFLRPPTYLFTDCRRMAERSWSRWSMRDKERKVRLYRFVADAAFASGGDIRISRSRGIIRTSSASGKRATRFSSGTLAHLHTHTCRSPARPCSPFRRSFKLSGRDQWNKKRRVVAKVESTRHPGEPVSSKCPIVIVTNLFAPYQAGGGVLVLCSPCHGGAAHQRKAGTPSTGPRLSCRKIRQQCRSAPASRPGPTIWATS